MLAPERIERVYLHRGPVDFRRGRNGLCAIVQEVMGQDPFGEGALFCFTSKRRDRLKCLWWDRTGFVLWYKVLEGKERYAWPRHLQGDAITISAQQLQWLLDGYDVWKMRPHRTLSFSRAA